MFRGEKNGMIDVLKGKHIMKGKCYVFSDYKEGKMFFNYSECKHQKHTYAWRNFKSKGEERVERTYLQKRKQQKRYCLTNIRKSFQVRIKLQLMFWGPKDSIKAKYYVFSDYKERN